MIRIFFGGHSNTSLLHIQTGIFFKKLESVLFTSVFIFKYKKQLADGQSGRTKIDDALHSVHQSYLPVLEPEATEPLIRWKFKILYKINTAYSTVVQ